MTALLLFLKQFNLYYTFSLAFLPSHAGVFYGIDKYIDSAPGFETFMEVTITTPKEYFFIAGSSNIYMIPSQTKTIRFTPLQDSFIFRSGFAVGIFQLGYEHYCSHPIIMGTENKCLPRSYYGGYSKVFLKVSNKN